MDVLANTKNLGGMRQLQGLDNEFGVGIHLLKLLLEHNHGNSEESAGCRGLELRREVKSRHRG